MAQHIICVGAVYIDTILNIPHFPIEDDKLRASSLVRRRGGNTANTLEVLSQLIMRVKTSSPQSMLGTPTILHLLSVLPMEDSDAFNFIQRSLPDVRMENSGIFRQGHKEAAQSFILRNEEVKENITRTIVSFNGLREMDILEFITRVRLLEMAEDARHGWYHFEGRIPEVTLDCIWHLRSDPASSDFKISVECEKPERQGMAEVAKEADLVFYSKIWAEKNGFNDAENFLKEQTKVARDGAILCCTWGAAGAAAVHKVSNNHREWATVNGWRPSIGAAPVIDTVGAGDTFIAGMLFALVNFKDEPLQQKLEFANEIAGRKVIQEGFGGLGFQMEMDFNRARSSSRTTLENS